MRLVLLRRLLLGRLLRLLPSAALLPAALSNSEPRGLAYFRILLFQFRQSFFGRFIAGRTGGRLNFAADLGHLRSNFLS